MKDKPLEHMRVYLQVYKLDNPNGQEDNNNDHGIILLLKMLYK